MKSLSILAATLFLLAPALSHAAGPETEFFTIDGQAVTFVHVPERGLLIDPACWRNQSRCLALRRLPQASLKSVRSQLSGGANPGAIVCLNLGGHTVIGVDARGNENSFCRFNDGSLISSGSLHAHARENDSR